MPSVNILLFLNIMTASRILLLKETKQGGEREISFLGNRFKNVAELKDYEKVGCKENQVKMLKDPIIRPFSIFKVVNDIQLFYPRRHPRYSLVLDRKFMKLLHRRSYIKETLYQYFRNIYQLLKLTLLRLEKEV